MINTTIEDMHVNGMIKIMEDFVSFNVRFTIKVKLSKIVSICIENNCSNIDSTWFELLAR